MLVYLTNATFSFGIGHKIQSWVKQNSCCHRTKKEMLCFCLSSAKNWVGRLEINFIFLKILFPSRVNALQIHESFR
jgi:hypothetical protein